VDTMKSTIYHDEAEDLRHPRDAGNIYNLYNDGYTKGATTPRCKETTDGYEVKEYNSYSGKAFGCIHEIHSTLQDRCIRVVLRKADDAPQADREPHRNDPRWAEIRNKCYLALLNHWEEVRDVYKNLENETDMGSREFQLWRGLFTLAKCIGDDVYERVKEYAKEWYGKRIEESRAEDNEIVLLETLIGLDDYEKWWAASKVKEEFVERLDGTGDWVSASWIGSQLKKLKVYTEKVRRKSGIHYMFDPKEIIRAALRQRMDEDKIKEHFDSDLIREALHTSVHETSLAPESEETELEEDRTGLTEDELMDKIKELSYTEEGAHIPELKNELDYPDEEIEEGIEFLKKEGDIIKKGDHVRHL